MPSSTQYSLRSLFVLTLLVGVVAAIVAPLVRSWNTERQLLFAAQAGISTAMTVVALVMLSFRRYAVEQRTGRLLQRLARRRTLLKRVGQAALAAFLAIAVVAQWIVQSEERFNFAGTLQQGFLLSGFSADLIATHWWNVGPDVVELREQGLVRRGLFDTPWSRVTRCYWNRYFPDVLMVVVERFDTWELNVPPRDREAVEQVFRQKCGNEVGPPHDGGKHAES